MGFKGKMNNVGCFSSSFICLLPESALYALDAVVIGDTSIRAWGHFLRTINRCRDSEASPAQDRDRTWDTINYNV